MIFICSHVNYCIFVLYNITNCVYVVCLHAMNISMQTNVQAVRITHGAGARNAVAYGDVGMTGGLTGKKLSKL